MFAGIIAIRSTLKRFMKSNTLACIGLAGQSNAEEDLAVVKINRVGILTVDLDYIDGDMQTAIQSGTILITNITSVRSLSTYMTRIQLLNNNPDLLLEDSLEYMGHDCEEYLDVEDED